MKKKPKSKNQKLKIVRLPKLKFDKNPNQEDQPYNYLIKMPMDSVSEESVSKLLKDKEDKQQEYNILEKKSVETIWLEELEELKIEYMKLLNSDKEKNVDKEKDKVKTKVKIVKK